jgi:hypothetical protein
VAILTASQAPGTAGKAVIENWLKKMIVFRCIMSIIRILLGDIERPLKSG